MPNALNRMLKTCWSHSGRLLQSFKTFKKKELLTFKKKSSLLVFLSKEEMWSLDREDNCKKEGEDLGWLTLEHYMVQHQYANKS